MADRFAPDWGLKNTRRAGVFGSAEIDDFSYTVAAATPASNTDKLYLGVIEPGYRVEIMDFIWSGTAPGASVTTSLGYEPVDAAKGPTANTTYWASAVATAAAGRNASAAAPITFDQPVKLVATIGGANVANGAVLSAIPHMKRVGVA